MNRAILDDMELTISESTLQQAKEDGAMALFGEKYSGVVRVVKIGDFSLELCGGTHVSRTSQIGTFKVLSEGSIGAGLRRVEAVTGESALDHICEHERLLDSAAAALKVSVAEVPQAIERMLDAVRAAEKRVEELQRRSAVSEAEDLASKVVEYNGVRFVASRVATGDSAVLSSLADSLANTLKSAVIVLAGTTNGKVAFVVKVTPDLVDRGFHAANMIREIAKVAGGGGGGRPDFAQAGGKDVEKLDDALAKAGKMVQELATG